MPNAISTAAQDFLRWWAEELRGLLPRSLHAPLKSFQRRLVLSIEGGDYRVLTERGGQFEELNAATDTDDALLRLAEAAKARPGTSIVLRFGRGDCFARTLHLPAAAERDFARILDLDLERTTPFRCDDVLTAHCIDNTAPAPSGKRTVRQIVVKRRSVEPLIARMRELGLTPAAADCWNEARNAGLPVNLLAAASAARPRRAIATLSPGAMAAAVALLAVTALGMYILRHQSALASLEAEVATARAEAQQMRAAFESTEAVHAQIATLRRLARDRISAARIIDELTAVIPDSAWVYDLRIDAATVEFTGFARSAAALIPLLEQSRTFTAATLTSPVVMDGAEDKERFSIRVRLRGVPDAEPRPESQDAQPLRGDL